MTEIRFDEFESRTEGGKLHVWAPFTGVARPDGFAVATRYALWARTMLIRLSQLVDEGGEPFALQVIAGAATARREGNPITVISDELARTGVACHRCGTVRPWRVKNGHRRGGSASYIRVWLEDADRSPCESNNVVPICWRCHQKVSKPPIPRENNRFVARDRHR